MAIVTKIIVLVGIIKYIIVSALQRISERLESAAGEVSKTSKESMRVPIRML